MSDIEYDEMYELKMEKDEKDYENDFPYINEHNNIKNSTACINNNNENDINDKDFKLLFLENDEAYFDLYETIQKDLSEEFFSCK
jgi:hypothetical protein